MRENEQIEELLKTQIILLSEIVELLTNGTKIRVNPPGRKGFSSLSQEARDSVDEEIDLELWHSVYGEECLPAKYMNKTAIESGEEIEDSYSKEEAEYLFNRLQDYLKEEVNGGSHIFEYVGKVWCKREKNSRNCFACVPKKLIGTLRVVNDGN